MCGPPSLLNRSSAIGGLVGVIDRRIPISISGEPAHTRSMATDIPQSLPRR